MPTEIQHSTYVSMVRAILLDDATAVAELAYRLDDVNMVDDTGRTILHIAVMHGSDQVLAPLLSAGADVGIVNEYGLTPIGLALRDGAETIARILRNAQIEAEKNAEVSGSPDLAGEEARRKAAGKLLSMEVQIKPSMRYANLRNTASEEGRVVATAVPATRMVVVGISQRWVEVELGPGVRGWAHRDWLDRPIGAETDKATPSGQAAHLPQPSNDVSKKGKGEDQK
tara:strand:+ start:4419 stop:5099 length:681 start_codon:yes stop_codon:yes gene_type:complete